MDVESWEPTILSGFFRLKNSVTIAEHNKLHPNGFLRKPSLIKIPSDHDDMHPRDTGLRRVETSKKISQTI